MILSKLFGRHGPFGNQGDHLVQAAIPPLAFTVRDAVAYSGLSRSRLYTLIQSGELPSLQVGGRRMIRRDAIDTFFANLAEAA